MERSISLLDHFATIPDFRVERRRRHKLIDILMIGLCSMLAGAETFVEMHRFGRCKQEWFSQWLDLPNGIPSHDTFNRVFAQIKPQVFQECFLSWVLDFQEYLRQLPSPDPPLGKDSPPARSHHPDEIVALDGKALRGTVDKVGGKSSIYMVSAWSSVNSLTLGQMKVDSKSNEITAIPVLLRFLELAGCIVTIDAMGCQKEIARQIIEAGGEYVLALKKNHPTLMDRVERFYEEEIKAGFQDQPHEILETREKGHGRIERRRYYLVPIASTVSKELSQKGTKVNSWLDPEEEWSGLEGIIMVESEREVIGSMVSTPAVSTPAEEPLQEQKSEKEDTPKEDKPKVDKPKVERRFYLTSLGCNVRRVARAVRGHWGIENSVHWSLDVAFDEDHCRVRVGHAAENLAILRHIALNLLKQETSSRVGIKIKRRMAGWDVRYLVQLLTGPLSF